MSASRANRPPVAAVRAVAHALLERLPRTEAQADLLGYTHNGVYMAVDGFALVVAGPAAALLPNAVILEAPVPRASDAGDAKARVSRGGLSVGALRLCWDPHRVAAFDPRLRGLPAAERRSRGSALLRALGLEPCRSPAALAAAIGRAQLGLPLLADRGLELLLRALEQRNRERLHDAAELLLGAGSGLTPVGDDLLTGAVAVAAAEGEAAAELRAALAPLDLRRRTTQLSATLLELALEGRIAAPLQAALEGRTAGERCRGTSRLMLLGHSTGRAYAAAAGAASFMLPD